MMELWPEALAIVSFLVLLAASVFMILQFYVCDNHNCKAFQEADEVAPRGTKDYVIALLNELYNDGIWPLPYIGAAIVAPLSLWLLGVPITVRNFAIVFLVSFIVIYFLFSFFGHHYVKFISNYVSNYIEDNCPTLTTTDNIEVQEDQRESIENLTHDNVTISPQFEFRRFDEGLDVTFAPPVTSF